MSDLKSILNEEYSKAGEVQEETLNIKELLGMVEEVLELPISEYLAPDLMEEKEATLTEKILIESSRLLLDKEESKKESSTLTVSLIQNKQKERAAARDLMLSLT